MLRKHHSWFELRKLSGGNPILLQRRLDLLIGRVRLDVDQAQIYSAILTYVSRVKCVSIKDHADHHPQRKVSDSHCTTTIEPDSLRPYYGTELLICSRLPLAKHRNLIAGSD